jgi:hypothetical protein
MNLTFKMKKSAVQKLSPEENFSIKTIYNNQTNTHNGKSNLKDKLNE